MKIYSTYKPVIIPLGGANNFINALFESIEKRSGKIVFKFSKDINFIFINQLSRGHGRGFLSFFSLIKLMTFKLIYKKPIFTRVVNLNAHAFNKGPRYYLYGFLNDMKTFVLIFISNHVIFQSDYQKQFFLNNAPFFINKETKKYHIIHNGADNVFYNNLKRNLLLNEKLILVSNTFSTRATKLHNLIAKISLLDNVEVLHIGNWPKNIDSHKVQMMGILSKKDIVATYLKAHFLLHTAIKDPCPNVIFEAILNGLPVLYNPNIGSSTELVMDNGIALDSNNIHKTIEKSYDTYDSLIRNVNLHKSYYSIDRSISDYLNIFNTKIQ